MSSKQPYTNPYLHERVSKVTQAQQKKGKILVTSYKNCAGLPTREDLSDLRHTTNLHLTHTSLAIAATWITKAIWGCTASSPRATTYYRLFYVSWYQYILMPVHVGLIRELGRSMDLSNPQLLAGKLLSI